MNFLILSFQLIYNFARFLKCDREKGSTFCDKGQNSCCDVDFSGTLLHTNDKWARRSDKDS